MIGAHDPAGAVSTRTIEQARGAMPTDVMKSPHHAIVAAQGKKHLADEVEALIVPDVGNFGDVTDDLPGRPEDALPLEREELRVGVGPGGQAEIAGGNLSQVLFRKRFKLCQA